MLDALIGGLTIGLFVLGIYLPVALVRAAKKWFNERDNDVHTWHD